MKLIPIRLALAFLLVLPILSACDYRADVEVVGMRTGVSRQQYLAMPDSARLEDEKDATAPGGADGLTVEVIVKLDGVKGQKVPLDYTIHDARNSLPFVSRRTAIQPDAERWSRQGHLWLPMPSAGTYYVQLVLADSTGRKPVGPRTEEFTVR